MTRNPLTGSGARAVQAVVRAPVDPLRVLGPAGTSSEPFTLNPSTLHPKLYTLNLRTLLPKP
jgi:hypothetical protein